MTCQPDQRDRVRQAARELRALDCVVAADVLDPSTGPFPSWSIDVVAHSPSGTVPWRVAAVIADYRLAHRATPQGDHIQIAGFAHT
jgi:hypothetical protein